jgi:hypothetical protein
MTRWQDIIDGIISQGSQDAARTLIDSHNIIIGHDYSRNRATARMKNAQGQQTIAAEPEGFAELYLRIDEKS